MYTWKYITSDGLSDIILNSGGKYLTGLIFEGAKDEKKCNTHKIEKYLPIFEKICRWLYIYFSGVNPDFTP